MSYHFRSEQSSSNQDTSSGADNYIGSDSHASDSESTYFDSEKSRITEDSNPTEIRSRAFIFCPSKLGRELRYGKWLVFRPFPLLDETWHFLREKVHSGVLSSCTTGARSSCMFYNPSLSGPGRHTTGVVIVYTTEADIDTAGFILINLVKHDIKYKSDRATHDGKYQWKGGYGSVCLKTLYWNDGEPSFECRVDTKGPTFSHQLFDKWNLNRVIAPRDVMANTAVYGYWTIVHEREFNLTDFWHHFKPRIESGKLGPVEMVCPPKRDPRDPKEMVIFLLYTAYENVALVGTELAKYIRKNIYYTVTNRESHRPNYNHQVLWREDEPEYVMTLIRPRGPYYY